MRGLWRWARLQERPGGELQAWPSRERQPAALGRIRGRWSRQPGPVCTTHTRTARTAHTRWRAGLRIICTGDGHLGARVGSEACVGAKRVSEQQGRAGESPMLRERAGGPFLHRRCRWHSHSHSHARHRPFPPLPAPAHCPIDQQGAPSAISCSAPPLWGAPDARPGQSAPSTPVLASRPAAPQERIP